MLISVGRGPQRTPFTWPTLRQAFIGAAAFFVLVFCAQLVGSGRVSYTAVAFGIGLAPVLLYVALVRPFAFPFALWAALVPFDNLLSVGRGATVTRLLAIVCGAAFLFLVLRHKRLMTPPRAILTWLLYAGWAAASIAWAGDQNVAVASFERIIQLVLLYAVVSIVPTRRSDVWIVLGGAIVGAVASAIYGAWLFHHQSAAIAASQQQFSRLQIDFGDRGIDVNAFADALLFPSIALAVGLLSARSIALRVASGVLFAVCLIGLNYSGSRESFVALAAGLLYLVVVVPKYRARLFATAAIALGASLANPALWLRFAQSFTTGGSGRSSIWKTALAAVRDHPLLGVGTGNFSNAYNSVYLNVFQQYNAGWGRASHDIFLHTLVELGAIGLIVMCVALYAQYRSTDAIADDGQWKELKLIVRASMIALVVAAVFLDMMDAKYLWLLFCFAAMLRNAPQYPHLSGSEGTRGGRGSLAPRYG